MTRYNFRPVDPAMRTAPRARAANRRRPNPLVTALTSGQTVAVERLPNMTYAQTAHSIRNAINSSLRRAGMRARTRITHEGLIMWAEPNAPAPQPAPQPTTVPAYIAYPTGPATWPHPIQNNGDVF